jgi:hypothetical protein
VHLYSENGSHLGWFDKDTAIRVTKGLEHVVYAMACCEEKPDNKILPCFVKGTVYIGMSTGKQFDKKNKKYPGSVQMNSTKRMFKHNEHMYNPKTMDKKYRLFHETYELFHDRNPDLPNPNLKIWYSFSIPNKDMKEILMKSFLHMVEDEFIYFYIKEFDMVPIMNLDHKLATDFELNNTNFVDRRIPNTISHAVMRGNRLTEFIAA